MMSRFTGLLAIRFQEEPERSAMLLEELAWEVDEEGSQKFVIVPVNFMTDGASVPRFIWWLLPPWGDKSTRAAILHDYLRSCISWGRPNVYAPTFRDCDKQFYLALKACKVNAILAWVIYKAMRVYNTFWGDHSGEAYGPPV